LQTWTFLTLPVIGLYFSLRRANFISALLWTLFVGIFLPLALPRLLFLLQHWVLMFQPQMWPLPRAAFRGSDVVPFITFFQAAFAIIAGNRLYRNLLQRNFAFQKAVA
jgi:hypothetical protein